MKRQKHMQKTIETHQGQLPRQDCTSCGVNPCYTEGKPNERFEGCPMISNTETLRQAATIYDEPLMRDLARASAKIEAGGNLKWTRVEDTIEFARQMGYEKVGIACCIGLKREAAGPGVNSEGQRLLCCVSYMQDRWRGQGEIRHAG